MANTRDVMGEQACLDALVGDTLTEFEDDGVTKVKLAYHYSLRQVTLPNATALVNSAFYADRRLESVSLGSINDLSNNCFNGCISLRQLNVGFPTSVGNNAFSFCTSISKDTISLAEVKAVYNNAFEYSGIGEIILPKCTTLGQYIGKGERMSVADLGKITTLSYRAFSEAYALCHLVLRGASSVVTCDSTALNVTAIARGVGWIYVPSELVDSFKANSTWSRYTSQIVSIDEYPKALQDETISDSWATIAASTTYATDYPIGSIKYVNIGGTRLAMQLVATDTDDLAEGGKARMTWVSRDSLLRTRMFIANGDTGGWASCFARNLLRTIIYPQIEQDVRNAIKEVTKTYRDDTGNTQSIVDTVWIPSSREIFYSSSTTTQESSGCDYGSFFIDSNSRVKNMGIGGSSGSWWLRTADGIRFIASSPSGSTSSITSDTSNGVVLGFCI